MQANRESRKSTSPRVVGLTGNIACGKSEVSKILTEMGVPVIDADLVSREVTTQGSLVLDKICLEFGSVLDPSGNLDRLKLRKIIFQNDSKRKKLEEILHPEILKRSTEKLNELRRQGHLLIIYEAPLLIEAGRHEDFDGTLFISCDPAIQLNRLLKRDPTLTAEFAKKIIAAQMPQAKKASFATWIIDNSGTKEQLKKEVFNWANKLINFSQNEGKN